MNEEFLAKTASFEEDDAAMVLVFSSSEDGAANYLMLQYPLQTDEQDRHLCLDDLYIELDDQTFGCYHGVDSIRRIGDRIEIELTSEGKRRLHRERLVIAPVHWSPIIDQGLARLAELSRGEYDVETQ
jgi:hypothetical protein